MTVIIFFGKSAKNIWNLDFFNYNHRYRISETAETDLFVEQYHRATAEQFITAKYMEQYHSRNSHNSYHSYNTYNVKQSNSKTANHLERYHSLAAKTD